MPNHLIGETSPYLLQHAENPVDWWPWGEAALARARLENKPIFLSIGYAACHWCHVMAHESFDDPSTASILNEHFVSIKVDREQRPDLDEIYMQATITLTGSGGWPMSVFLTPELHPFYAGTYFPPSRRYNLPGFPEILTAIAQTWKEDPAEVHRVAEQVVASMTRAPRAQGGVSAQEQQLEDATRVLVDTYDWEFGGWGAAPKFPQPMSIEFLLRRAVGVPGDGNALKVARHALSAMARGGMYDVVGGGFARYSTDSRWHVPHFEKMLYDNAQLALAYLHAWQITWQPAYERVATETLDFVAREMTHPDGGFYSSLDADSEGVEGKFYVWTKDEIRAALPDHDDFSLFTAAYGVTAKGNWEGTTVLQRVLDDATLAARFQSDSAAIGERLSACHAQLRAARAGRIRPATDDKVLTSWNALMLRAFAQASRFLGDGMRRTRYREVATRNAEFLLRSLRPGGDLRRTWRDGSIGAEVFLEDYAGLALGLLDLYQCDFDNRRFPIARELVEEMISRFSDPDGGFFDAPNDGEKLPVRPKQLQDSAMPSGNSIACEALFKLAAFTGDGGYRDRAEHALSLVAGEAPRHPTSYAGWLNAGEFGLSRQRQLALLSPTVEQLQPFLELVNDSYRPDLIVAASTVPPTADAPPLLADRALVEGGPAAYLCEHFVCEMPVTAPQDLQRLL
jgi:uncharacterized protein YyaL (SSP411 family)